MINLKEIRKVHFIGIGGIGMSAVAKMLLLEGKIVTGSDTEASLVTDELKKAGANIFIGQDAKNISPDVDLVVYTVAIREDNPEFIASKKLGVNMATYPEMLGIISEGKFVIAIAGTHGKTTTTAMVASILIEAGLSPTVLVGSLMRVSNHPPTPSLIKEGEPTGGGGLTNFIFGESKYFIVEADEYKRSFMNLTPNILVINNIDEDHLDYYKDLAGVQTAFIELAKKLGPDGFLVTRIDDPHIEPVVESVDCTVIDYPSIVDTHTNGADKLSLKIPGAHNIENAKAALGVAAVLSIDVDVAIKALNNFKSPWRRFELLGMTQTGAIVYDDYAHNPQKVKAALEGAREMFPDKRIVVVFQPHLYSRTKLLLDDFSKVFGSADEIILAPIYAAREVFDGSITSEMLAKKIREKGGKVFVCENFEEIIAHLSLTLDSNDVLITMGAGDVYKIARAMIQ